MRASRLAISCSSAAMCSSRSFTACSRAEPRASSAAVSERALVSRPLAPASSRCIRSRSACRRCTRRSWSTAGLFVCTRSRGRETGSPTVVQPARSARCVQSAQTVWMARVRSSWNTAADSPRSSERRQMPQRVRFSTSVATRTTIIHAGEKPGQNAGETWEDRAHVGTHVAPHLASGVSSADPVSREGVGSVVQLDPDVRIEGERSRVPGAVLAACSLIVPGAGQMLARRWVRGVLMLLAATAAGICRRRLPARPVARARWPARSSAARC